MRPVLLCLHGWGGSKESFTELRAALKGADVEILTPDLPGFGDEQEPTKPWSTDDYADWVERWLRQRMENGKWKMENTKLMILGHSHGGRIAIKLATRRHLPFSIFHLYLCAAAGIRHPRHLKRIVGLTLAKAGKFFLSVPGLRSLAPLGKKFLYRLVRVHDYEKASPVMRQTLIKVSAEDLRPLLHNVTVPTDIFWGEDDRMTPVSDAYVMHKAIAKSQLHVYPGIRHAVHREKAGEIAEHIRKIH
jgi:pimeloyl-ACP methyl ester carboxylesterase